MLRLIILTKRRYKKIEKQEIRTNEEIEETDFNDMRCTDDESGDGLSTTTHNDVDSEVSFEDDADKEIDTILIEGEDWSEYIERSIYEAMEKMESAKIRCWNKTHKKMKWNLAMRIATSPSDRWLRKAAEWNPELSSRYRTNRAIGRPRKRCEDDINEFLKEEFDETESPIESENPIESNQTNKTWINKAKDRGRWALLEETYTMTVEERQEMRKRGNNQSRPARYFDAQFRFACINKMMHLKAAADPHSRSS